MNTEQYSQTSARDVPIWAKLTRKCSLVTKARALCQLGWLLRRIGMEIQDAIKVIRALADGVNPETRELMKDDSICRNPQAVMALNRALAALVTQQERELKKPASAGQYWSRAEDQQVCEELRKGMNFEDIAKTHNRSVPSIVARLVKLGKVVPEKSTPLFPPQVA
jgi:DNA-binding NarL/FixJ family response regulator